MGFFNRGRKDVNEKIEPEADIFDLVFESSDGEPSFAETVMFAPTTMMPETEVAVASPMTSQSQGLEATVYEARFVDDAPMQTTAKIEVSDMPTLSVYNANPDVLPNNNIVGVSTDIGRRDSQQDAAAVSDTSVRGKFSEKWMAILCDGMGGLEGGERASNLCVEQMLSMFRTNTKSIPEFYRNAIIETDIAVSNISDENGESIGAGSTLVSVVIDGDDLYWASVGDSHIYIIRGDSIVRTNREHNYLMTLMEQVEKGEISLYEAQSHKSKDALISYMGMGSVSLMDVIGNAFKLMPGDFVVLCSDGLYRAISQDEIFSVVNNNRNDMQKAADQLVSLALSKNNPYQDNTTVITISYQG